MKVVQAGLKAAAVVLAAAFAAPASAQSAPAARHIYVGGTVGQAHFQPGCPIGTLGCDDLDTALRVFGGYQINRIFAAEVGFANFGEARGTGVSLKGNAWDASLIAGWPIAGGLGIYGRLGIQRTNLKGGGTLANQQEDKYGPTYGLGLNWDLTPNVALRGEWQAYTNAGGGAIPDNDVRLMSVGALWRFR